LKKTDDDDDVGGRGKALLGDHRGATGSDDRRAQQHKESSRSRRAAEPHPRERQREVKKKTKRVERLQEESPYSQSSKSKK